MNNEPLQQNVTRAKRRALQVVFVTICCLTVLVNFLLAEVRAPDRFHAENTFRTNDLIVDQDATVGRKFVEHGTVLVDGSAVGSGNAIVHIAGADPANFIQMQISNEGDTNHTATQSIPLAIQQQAGMNTTAAAASAYGIVIENIASRVAGTNPLTSVGLLVEANNGQVNYCIQSPVNGGVIQVVDGGTIGATSMTPTTLSLTGSATSADFSATGSILLNENITSPKNTIRGDSTHTPQLSLGVTTLNDGTGIQVKNTNGAQGLSGLDLLADTAVNGNQSTGVFMTRGNGGGGGAAGNNPAGMGLIGNAGSIISNGSVGDMALYNQVAGGRVIFGADAVHAFYQMALDQLGNLYLGITGAGNLAVAGTLMHNGSASGSPATITGGQIITGGPGAPAINCNQGDLYTRNDGSTSTTLYACTAANTWTALGASGAGTPSMTIANATQSAAVNLSTTGTGQIDWLFASPTQQGNSTRVYDSFAATLETKLTGGGLLLSPGIDVIGSSGTNANSNGTVTFSSTASDTTTQTAISSASGNGITAAGVNAGLRFVAPVTTSSRVFRIYNSHSNSTWQCTAHLQDGSVSDKLTTASVATTAVEEVQTVTVTAGSNTNLIVSCIISATTGTAVIKWYAEILSLT